MALDRSRQESLEIDLREPGLPRLCHLQEVAQQDVEPVDLLENGVQGRFAARAVGNCQRVLRLQPHGGDRVADFVGEAGRHAAERRKPLGGSSAAALQRRGARRCC